MSFLTVTGLVNLALREIGTYRIEDYAENSAEAILARDVYDQCRVACISAHEWSFAKRLAELPLMTGVVPVARFTAAFQLPGDCIRVGVVSNASTLEPVMDDQSYRIQDGTIICSEEHVFIEYIADQPVVGTWPPWFVDYVAADLASRMASPLKSTTEAATCKQLAEKMLGMARSRDSVQSPVIRRQQGEWTTRMLSGRNSR